MVTDDASQIVPPGFTCYGAVWIQSWSQTTHDNFWGIFWSETQRGAYYFGCAGNGHQPWVWQASRFGWDNAGYHSCGDGNGNGFSISVNNCWRDGDPSQSYLYERDQFTVSVLFKGVPFSHTYTMCGKFDPFDNMFSC